MPGSLDSCINNIFEPGNIPASAGTTPVRVLLKYPVEVTVSEAATALDHADLFTGYIVAVAEVVAAIDITDRIVAVPLAAMLPGVFVNSDGTVRQAYVNGVMVNL